MVETAPSKAKTSGKKPYWVGVDLGGTKMMACVMDKNYKVLASAKKSVQSGSGAAKGLQRVVATIHEALEAAKVDPTGVEGIGMGCPGTVDTEQGILIHAPNLGWKRTQVTATLRKHFNCPVALLNDVDSGTFGEFHLGAGQGSRSLLGVFPGTGLGAGFVYDGHLVRGRNVSCMELGNIWLPGTHLLSPHPGAVLLEDLTSRLGVAAAASVECYRGQAPKLLAKTNAALTEMKSKALAGSYTENEEAIVATFQNSVRFLGMGIAIVVNLFGPDHITLGGGLVEELPNLYLTLLKQEVQRYAVPEIFRGIKFSVAKLGNHAVAIGAVAWLRQHPSF